MSDFNCNVEQDPIFEQDDTSLTVVWLASGNDAMIYDFQSCLLSLIQWHIKVGGRQMAFQKKKMPRDLLDLVYLNRLESLLGKANLALREGTWLRRQ